MLTCPICYSGNISRRFSVTANEAAQQFVLREANKENHERLARHIAKLWQQEECWISDCGDCHFTFADPFVAGDATYYNLSFEREGGPQDKWEYHRTLEELSSINFQGKRVLEVGANHGYFLDKIKDKYTDPNGITALEYNDKSLKILKEKGYAAYPYDLKTADLPPGFDAIFMFQVLEHMDNLDAVFKKLSELLAKNGILFIAVPNRLYTEFNESTGSLIDMPPCHISRWTAESFGIIGSRHGLKVEKHQIHPFSFLDFIKMDIMYSYLRRCQKPGTIHNWSRTKRSKKYGKFLGVIIALLFAPTRLPVWVKALSRRNAGNSFWVKITKN